ncbi:MAG TPA: hypothetical protein VG755_08725 [Nannocystaceae bacterium]|nr:hypothetical protein [Nannocystaceae bacterium]
MNINVERFLALTAMLAAPLVAAPGCIINGSDDDDTTASSSNTNAETGNETGSSTGNTSAPTTTQSDSTVGDTTAGDTTTAAESTVGDTTAGDTTAGETGADLGNCCVADDHGAGCEVTEVQDCVCAEDPICCDEGWDMFCVSEVNQFGCGTCELPAQVWDCFCTTDCDGAPVDTQWQVCGADDVEAAANGQMACEDDLDMMGCMAITCSDCVCSTAEIPKTDC